MSYFLYITRSTISVILVQNESWNYTHTQNSGSHFMKLFTKVEQIHTQSSCMYIPWSPSLLPLLYNRSCWHCPLFLLAFQYQVKINYVRKKTLLSILGQHKTSSRTVHWWNAVQKESSICQQRTSKVEFKLPCTHKVNMHTCMLVVTPCWIERLFHFHRYHEHFGHFSVQLIIKRSYIRI